MTTIQIETLLDLIREVVNKAPGSWQEKRDAVLAECSRDDRINLEEFAGWFVEEKID